jgi:hypothetical protein
MKIRLVKLITIATLMACALFVVLSSNMASSASDVEYAGAGFGSVENDVWLVDNGVGSVLPEAGENMLRIGGMRGDGKVATLKADLGNRAFADFELDLIVVTKAGMSPIENRVLVGTTTLFYKLSRRCR